MPPRLPTSSPTSPARFTPPNEREATWLAPIDSIHLDRTVWVLMSFPGLTPTNSNPQRRARPN